MQIRKVRADHMDIAEYQARDQSGPEERVPAVFQQRQQRVAGTGTEARFLIHPDEEHVCRKQRQVHRPAGDQRRVFKEYFENPEDSEHSRKDQGRRQHPECITCLIGQKREGFLPGNQIQP